MVVFKDKNKQKEYQNNWIHQRRISYINSIGNFCRICGGNINLNFHHIDRSTKISNSIWSWSKVKREAELLKCILVCQTCHYILHKPKPKHGITTTQYKKGCRCVLCKKAKAHEKAVWTFNRKTKLNKHEKTK